MGRSDMDASDHHHQGFEFEQIHQTPAAAVGNPAPPPQLEKDLYEPPAGYKTTTNIDKNQLPSPSSHVHAFPPPPSPSPEVHAFSPPSTQVHVFPPPQFPPTDGVQPQPEFFTPPQQPTAQNFPPPQHNYSPQPEQNPPPQRINHNLPETVAAVLAAQQQNQEWKTSLFGCLDNPQNAITTLFCPCVTFGQIAEVVDNGNTSCGASGTWYTLIACSFGMPCLLSCGYRRKLRARFGLAESAPDCLIHCFCDYCALCQEYRELEKRGFDPSIGYAGIVARQRQQTLQQLGMIPPLQQNMMN